MKRLTVCLGVILLLALFHGQGNAFQWYKIKEGATGVIFMRKGPAPESDYYDYFHIYKRAIEPLFKVIGEKDDWLKCLSNRGGRPINIPYVLRHFWVSKEKLVKVDLEKEGLAVLIPAEYEYYNGISIHSGPHIFSPSIRTIRDDWNFIYPAVHLTGKKEGPFVEIFWPHCLYTDWFGCCHRERQEFGFVYGEYFGIRDKGRYVKYSVPKILFTRSRYLNGEDYQGAFITREKPSILGKKAGVYGGGGMKVMVVGEENYFLKTSKGKWISYQSLVEKRWE